MKSERPARPADVARASRDLESMKTEEALLIRSGLMLTTELPVKRSG